MKKVAQALRLAALLLGGHFTEPMSAQSATAPEPANFDQRSHQFSKSYKAAGIGHAAAIAQLRIWAPDARVDFDEMLDSPAWIASARGFLAGTNGVNHGISPAVLAGFSADDPHLLTKAFVRQHAALFGHDADVLSAARIKREFVTAHNGLRTVVWEQQVDGIPVFEGLFISHTTRNGELVNVSSHFLANPEKAAESEALSQGQTAARSEPGLNVRAAVAVAAGNIGVILGTNEVTLAASPSEAGRHQAFSALGLIGTGDAQLVWLPVNRNTLRLCWEIILTSRARAEMFRVLIDARSGSAWLRQCLTSDLSPASYRVYTSESPAPLSPGYPFPTTNQAPDVLRALVSTDALDTNASPKGWIDDGNNTTTGNNVDAYLDRDGNDLPDGPRPSGSPFRVFDFPLDLTQDPIAYTNASVVNLFYWNNWMHDNLYELGFTEAAGNFQTTNFNRGGLGGDPVLAEAQEGNGFNNSSFSTPPDGMPGIMRMFIFNGPVPNRDGDLDTEVILHEYAHGLCNRRIGGGVGVTALQSLGLSEGWADFYSLALLTQSGNDVHACYPVGPYISYLLSGLTQNYYFGIRRYPYSTDLTKSPETFKDIDPAQASSHSGVPVNPDNSNSPIEVHSLGEIWCVALWDARANLIGKYGFASGNQLMLQLVTDGMNLAPANPTFLQARDALIQADLVDTAAANYQPLWQAFARRGMGQFAASPDNSTTTGVVESYQVPDDLLITPSTNFNAYGSITGPFSPASQNYQLINTGTNPMNWSTAPTVPWENLSCVGGTLGAAGGSTNLRVTLNPGANNLPVGSFDGLINITNLNSGVSQALSLAVNVSPPLVYLFSLDADPGWPRSGQWAFGPPTGQGGSAHGNPDPAAGATGTNVFGVNLEGDYSIAYPGGPYYLTAGPLDFTGVENTLLQFQRWLNTDAPPYANATIDVSADDTNWVSVFANTGAITDSSWSLFQYDISSVADNQPSVYLRWGYEILAGAFACSGWNLDDIAFAGASRLTVSLPTSATKGDGLLTGAGAVSIAHPPLKAMTINLTSGDVSKITVPAGVSLQPGQTNAVFDLTILDNHMLDGTEIVAIMAASPGYVTGSNSMTVFDNETATLNLTLPPDATNGAGQIQGLVSSSAAPVADITVSLASSDNTRLQVPSSVILPAGQTSVAFAASVPLDQEISGNVLVTVTAHVRNWTDAVVGVTIDGNDNTNLLLSLPGMAWESNGILTNAASVQIFGTLETNLAVNLVSSNPGKLSVPPTVTILAGQSSAEFNVTLVAGTPPESPLSATVGATAAGFAASAGAVAIADNQTPPAPFNPLPADFSGDNPVWIQLSWIPSLGEGVEYVANGGFESGDFSDWTTGAGTNSAFIINDGTVVPASSDAPTMPYAGNFSALADQPPPAIALLSQDVSLPANATEIGLRWVDRIRNFNDIFATNQQFRVEIRDTNDETLAVVFATRPGDLLLADWTWRFADLSGYAGQTIRLAFIVDAELAFLDVHLDEVSLRCANLPAATYDVYLGTNSIPAAADFLGSTTNTFLVAPRVIPLITYYWQVVARRSNQTAGPVWQFSSLPTLGINSVSVAEDAAGTTSAIFTVGLSDSSSQVVQVNFNTDDGTAVAPTDYSATNGTLSFASGVTNQIIWIPINWDTNAPATRTFSVNLFSPNNAAIGLSQGVGTILNDDSPLLLAPIPGQTLHADTTLTFTANGSDTNNLHGPLTFSLDPGAPPGAFIDPVSGNFSWTPQDSDVGTNIITIRLTDTGPSNLSEARTLMVIVVPRPEILSIEASGGQVILFWSSVPGQAYRVQSATSLSGGWNDLPGNITATNSTATRTVSTNPNAESFFRVLVLP